MKNMKSNVFIQLMTKPNHVQSNKNQTTILKPVKINLSTNQYPHLHVLFKSAFKCITHVVVFNFSFCVDIYSNSSISCVHIVYPMLTVCVIDLNLVDPYIDCFIFATY